MAQHIQTRTPNTPAGSNLPRAFTLIELVIVIVIISITAAIAIPRFSGASTRYRMESSLQQLISDLSITVADASQASQLREIRFDTTGETYELIGQPSRSNPLVDRVVYLGGEPYSCDIYKVSLGADRTIGFNPYGASLESGTVTIRIVHDYRTLIFTAGSAEIQVVEPTLAEADANSFDTSNSRKVGFDASAKVIGAL